MQGLEALGFSPAWAEAFAALAVPGLVPGRVVLEHGRFLRVATQERELLAVPTGRLRHEAASAAALPTVGDWVALSYKEGEELASIRHVLPRRSRFSRRSAGTRAVEQVVAANVDTVLLMMGLDADFNLRRLERYLSVAFGSGAAPVIVLNKADLCPELDARRGEVAALAQAVPIVTTRLDEPEGHAPVNAFLAPARTVALLGSSGVGKSTLLNRLLGEELQRTGTVRAGDGRGKHTTTGAQLFRLPGGALAIDTPGMRELQLWEADAGLGSAFDDVEALAAACRFRDCAHGEEPGCAVRAALASGELAAERFASFVKLRDELDASARAGRGWGGRGRGRPGR
jgi:ribosome biogenesis GTPase